MTLQNKLDLGAALVIIPAAAFAIIGIVYMLVKTISTLVIALVAIVCMLVGGAFVFGLKTNDNHHD